MPKLVWKKLVGQERVKDTLGAAFENDSLGHAYLFTGECGVGKFQAALELALAVLCLNENECPCYTCESCRQVRNHSHPDFELISPVSLEKEHRGSSGLSDKGWAYLDEVCQMRIASPYAELPTPTPPTIPVDWIRETNHAILRGTVGGRRNVAIMCGVDVMKKESANAMLKTLEEPPENTVIILTTERPHAVLPTIVSRCQIVRFGYVGPEHITEHLASEFSLSRDDPRLLSAVQASEGAVGRARALVEQPVNELMGKAQELLRLCFEKEWVEIAPQLDVLLAETLEYGKDHGACEKILTYVGHLVRDALVISAGGPDKYIRGESSRNPLKNAHLDATQASQLLGTCQDAISSVHARGNMHLVLVTWMISMMEMLHVEKQ